MSESVSQFCWKKTQSSALHDFSSHGVVNVETQSMILTKSDSTSPLLWSEEPVVSSGSVRIIPQSNIVAGRRLGNTFSHLLFSTSWGYVSWGGTQIRTPTSSTYVRTHMVHWLPMIGHMVGVVYQAALLATREGMRVCDSLEHIGTFDTRNLVSPMSLSLCFCASGFHAKVRRLFQAGFLITWHPSFGSDSWSNPFTSSISARDMKVPPAVEP